MYYRIICNIRRFGTCLFPLVQDERHFTVNINVCSFLGLFFSCVDGGLEKTATGHKQRFWSFTWSVTQSSWTHVQHRINSRVNALLSMLKVSRYF
jgi:hypothetical protein